MAEPSLVVGNARIFMGTGVLGGWAVLGSSTSYLFPKILWMVGMLFYMPKDICRTENGDYLDLETLSVTMGWLPPTGQVT